MFFYKKRFVKALRTGIKDETRPWGQVSWLTIVLF